MQNTQIPVSHAIVELIERTIREAMAPYGCRSVSVRAGEDHDGDPVIFVDVDYDLSQTPLELGVTGPLGTALRDKLWGAGEFRFPHIWHHFDEHQKVNTRRRAKA